MVRSRPGRRFTICWAVQWDGGMLGHAKMDDPSAMMNEHDENEEDAQANGGNREEVEGDEISDMVVEERPPGLGWRRAPLRHQPRHGSLGQLDAEPEKLGMNTWRTPERSSRRAASRC
jgi:hypothetical protein